jgi:hypothetical protein
MKNTILINEALEMSISMVHGPKTIPGIINAGKMFGFIKKAVDGYHWEIDSKLFSNYLKVINASPFAVAKRLGVSAGSLAYTLLQLRIEPKKLKFADNCRLYLEESDVRKIKKHYQRKNGKTESNG